MELVDSPASYHVSIHAHFWATKREYQKTMVHATAKVKSETDESIHSARAAAGAAGMASRWGNRGPSKPIRVDVDAAELLAKIPESMRRRIASKAIRTAASDWLKERDPI